MTDPAPDLWKSASTKAIRRGENPKRRRRAMTGLANSKDSALRATSGAEKHSSNPEAMRLTLDREKTTPSEECTTAPNENKISQRWRERPLAAMEVIESWEYWLHAGQGLAASLG